MQNYIDKIPFSLLVSYLFIGLILFIIFNIINRYVIPLIKEKQHFFELLWQKIQIITWLLFFGLFYASLFRANMAITIVFTFIVLGLGWNYWRNVFYGIIIRFKDQLKKGDYISTDFTKGKIKSVYLSQSELINDKGELIIIPNYKLRSSVLKYLQETNNIKVYSFSVTSSNNESTNDIYRFALNCPYISVNHDIIVERNHSNKFQVKASIIDNSFIESIERYFDGLK